MNREPKTRGDEGRARGDVRDSEVHGGVPRVVDLITLDHTTFLCARVLLTKNTLTDHIGVGIT